ncbi:hypothetical protein ACWFMI_27420 [Nocardiopsis terrae]
MKPSPQRVVAGTLVDLGLAGVLPGAPETIGVARERSAPRGAHLVGDLRRAEVGFRSLR